MTGSVGCSSLSTISWYVCGDDSREDYIADVQSARGALFEHVESLSGQDVFDIERPPGDNRFDDEEARGALASLLDEFAVQLGSGFNLVMEEVERERLGRPPVWQRVLGGIRYEVKYKERIEGGSNSLELSRSSGTVFHKDRSQRSVPGSVPAVARHSPDHAHGRNEFMLHSHCIVYLEVCGSP